MKKAHGLIGAWREVQEHLSLRAWLCVHPLGKYPGACTFSVPLFGIRGSSHRYSQTTDIGVAGIYPTDLVNLFHSFSQENT